MKNIDITEYVDEEIEYGKQNAKINLKYILLILSVCVCFCVGFYFIIRLIYLRGAYIPDNKDIILSSVLSLISGLALGIGIFGLFGKRIVLKHTDDKYKEYVSVSFDWNMKNYNSFFRAVSKVVYSLVIIGALLFEIVSLNMTGLYDDHFKHIVFPFEIETVSYFDVDIYKIDNHYDYDKKKYVEYTGNVYAFKYGDGQVITFEECENNSKKDNFIKSIAEEYDKQINLINSDNELYDF